MAGRDAAAIRRRVGAVVVAETKAGSFLVEAIHGIRR